MNYDCDYDKWSQYLFNIINKHGCKKGMDAACGTGNITIRLKKAELDVIGVDMSPDMLNIAQEKSGGNILFINADIKSIKLPKAVDFINCADDGINYIEKRQLNNCFKNFYNNLKKGGLLLFDISSGYKLKEIIGGNTFFDDIEDMTFIWNNRLKGDKVFMNIIIFVKQQTKYLRFDENHIQYIYQADYITQQLNSVGFKDIEVYDFLTQNPPKKHSQRLQFKAIKG